MRSMYQALTSFEGNGDEFHDYLKKMQLSIFDNIYAVYPDRDKCQKAIIYILHAYSVDSEFVVSGESWTTSKERCAGNAGLDENQIRELVHFEWSFSPKEKKEKKEDESEEDDGTEELVANDYAVNKIIQVIEGWLKYQNDKWHTHLLRMKDNYEQVSEASHSMPKKGNYVDHTLKSQWLKESNELFEMIDIWEEKLALRQGNLQARSELNNKKIVLRPENTVQK